jgi:hypothetical protein
VSRTSRSAVSPAGATSCRDDADTACIQLSKENTARLDPRGIERFIEEQVNYRVDSDRRGSVWRRHLCNERKILIEPEVSEIKRLPVRGELRSPARDSPD